MQWITLGELFNNGIPDDATAIGKHTNSETHIGQPL